MFVDFLDNYCDDNVSFSSSVFSLDSIDTRKRVSKFYFIHFSAVYRVGAVLPLSSVSTDVPRGPEPRLDTFLRKR